MHKGVEITMKKIIVGGIFLFCGVILFLGAYIPAAQYVGKLVGWSTPPGKLGTALNDIGGVSVVNYSVTLMIVGVVLLLWGGIIEGIISSYKEYKADLKSSLDSVQDKSSDIQEQRN